MVIMMVITEVGNTGEKVDVGEEKIMSCVETEVHSCDSFIFEDHINSWS